MACIKHIMSLWHHYDCTVIMTSLWYNFLGNNSKREPSINTWLHIHPLSHPYRPCLSWRDVQSIMVYTGVTVDSNGAVWVRNGAGLLHSDQHGFGLMDSYSLSVVSAAWPLLPRMSIATINVGKTSVAMTTMPLITRHTGKLIF